MKRIISLAVVCCMFMLTTVSGFAQTTNPLQNSVPIISVPTVEGMISTYDEMGFNVNVITKEINHAEYELEIDTEYGIVEATVDATMDNKGNQTLKYSENGKYNVLEYKTNGDIFLDGEKVEVKTESTVTSLDPPTIKGQRYNKWQKACPYGVASDYSTVYQTISKNLTFQQAISSYGVSVLCGLLVAIFLTGLPALFLGSAVTIVVSYFLNNNPTARAMSGKDVSYVHKTKGAYIIDMGEYIYKHIMTFYATQNYTNQVSTSTDYNRIKT